MKLSDFLARAKETAAEMHADTSTSTADLTKLDEAIELLDEYAQDAGALELSIHELPRYVSLYKGNIEQLEGVYEQSAERTRRERFLAAFESPATIERIATVLSELANDAGLEFIPKGTIVVECGFAN